MTPIICAFKNLWNNFCMSYYFEDVIKLILNHTVQFIVFHIAEITWYHMNGKLAIVSL